MNQASSPITYPDQAIEPRKDLLAVDFREVKVGNKGEAPQLGFARRSD